MALQDFSANYGDYFKSVGGREVTPQELQSLGSTGQNFYTKDPNSIAPPGMAFFQPDPNSPPWFIPKNDPLFQKMTTQTSSPGFLGGLSEAAGQFLSGPGVPLGAAAGVGALTNLGFLSLGSVPGFDAGTGAVASGAGGAVGGGSTIGSMLSPNMPGAFQVADSGVVSDVPQGLGVGGAGASMGGSVMAGGAVDPLTGVDLSSTFGPSVLGGGSAAGLGAGGAGTGLSIADLAKYGGLVSGAGSLLGAGASLLGANKIAAASGNAVNSLQGMFNVQNAQQAPYRAAGYGALNTINAGLAPGGQFAGAPSTASINSFLNPAMAFGIGQGVGAVTNLNNASGGAVGGNTLKAITDYATNSALNQYWNPAVNLAFQNQSNVFNRLANVAGLGQTANAQGTQLAGTLAPTIGNTIVGSGAAQAAGTVGAASNLASGANNAMGWYSLPTIMNAGQNAGY